MVTEFDFVVLVAQLKSEFNGEIYKQVKHYKIERRDVVGDIEYLRDAEEKFWKMVQDGRKPNTVLPEI